MKALLSLACVMGIAVSTAPAELKPGGKMPRFKAEAEGTTYYSDASFKGVDVLVVCITCNGCPVAKAYEDRFNEFQKKYGENKKVDFIAINCNSKTENLKKVIGYAKKQKLQYKYAFDDTGYLVKGLGARVTPHLFVFDKSRKLAYVGAYDDNMKADKVKSTYVVDAVEALLAGKEVKTKSTKAVGCGIKIRKD